MAVRSGVNTFLKHFFEAILHHTVSTVTSFVGGICFFIYRLIYYLEPSVLTGLSCTVMILCLADYLVPTLAPRVFGSNKW